MMLPREHGAWAMLLMPYLLGVIAAGRVGWPSALLLVSVLLLFTASRPLELARQGRSGSVPRLLAYGAVGGAAGVVLLLVYGRWMLVPIGVAAGAVLASQIFLRRRRLERTTLARLASVAALSATGPAACYATTGLLDARALAVWAMACLYSGASVFYVRLYYRPPDRQKQSSALASRLRAERLMAGYVIVAVGILVGLGVVGFAPPFGALTLLPMAIKAALAFRRRESRPTLRQIGLTEMGHSALFLALASAVMWMWV